MLDLNSLAANLTNSDGTWTLVGATAISENGRYICGTASNGSVTHGYLLTAAFPERANLDGKWTFNGSGDRAGRRWRGRYVEGATSPDPGRRKNAPGRPWSSTREDIEKLDWLPTICAGHRGKRRL